MKKQHNNDKKKMNVNKESAMQLWKRDYGKEQKVFDFSGRTIYKSAYGQKGSQYSWNVDHILPKSQGGKNNADNLVCTHVLTNSEKADKFPCFTANKKRFQITSKNGKWIIEQIEEKKKNADADKSRAITFWNNLFGKNVQITTDFAGRSVEKAAFGNSNHPKTWNIDTYANSEINDGNVYIAHIDTIHERSGKPCFTANDVKWQVKNDSGQYAFNKVSDNLNIYEPHNIVKIINELGKVNGKAWVNYVIIKYQEAYNSRVKEFIECLSQIVSLNYKPIRIQTILKDNMFAYEFRTDTKEQVQNICNLGVLIKTYSSFFCCKFCMTKIVVINVLEQMDELTANFSLEDLFLRQPTFENFAKQIKGRNDYAIYNTLIRGGVHSEGEMYVSGLVANNIKDEIKGFDKNKFKNYQLYENTYVYTETAKKLKSIKY